ncbi:biotin-dependent carboxyltransferase family protein [Lentibacillus sediminis]|uniref:5-oxoprolinase subunit C family protein n=1 Tax=Lentibacillus sediminis TaxID=1940529 RepID=UPI000C1C5967|nr:biotin-dependent carboxyltransferase family protein [Lentibacillus sediminis]
MQSKQIFKVHKPGVLTTFQDMGRSGFQRFGVPVSGAMDRFALQVANILAGNPRDYACLEVTLVGPKLEAVQPITIAITGAALNPKINQQPAAMWKTIRMEKGDRLTFGGHQTGVRAYIAVAGGFAAREVFGSMSADLKSGFGSQLEKEDCIYGYPKDSPAGIGLEPSQIPRYSKHIRAAVIEGPHSNVFTAAGREHFFTSPHVVDASSNRMGYRLQSEKITLKKHAEIWSEAVPFGGIQVPHNGQPIILMADRQTTGGYPRIGTVISYDLPKIAQLIPKGEITFYPISVEEAQEKAVAMEKFLRELKLFRNHLY